MNSKIKLRVLEEANIIIATGVTLRKLSKLIGVSKSTIHYDMNNRLKELNEDLYFRVKKIFLEHINNRNEKSYKKLKKNNVIS